MLPRKQIPLCLVTLFHVPLSMSYPPHFQRNEGGFLSSGDEDAWVGFDLHPINTVAHGYDREVALATKS